ncbi:hypothetical protein BT93_L5471 [Corymbia citriodora subsp. variegata]|uniref:Uncharacterized protein n=1 Tax=Corymbia citriodora subsp. variegata TaxID=360336 RepID=A0A8T0CWB6_CORYI|nr:hypothetical protein BT93_L5471 [Corymbia citriodora subsp. variegata]
MSARSLESFLIHVHKLSTCVQALTGLRKGVLLTGFCKCYGEVIK